MFVCTLDLLPVYEQSQVKHVWLNRTWLSFMKHFVEHWADRMCTQEYMHHNFCPLHHRPSMHACIQASKLSAILQNSLVLDYGALFWRNSACTHTTHRSNGSDKCSLSPWKFFLTRFARSNTNKTYASFCKQARRVFKTGTCRRTYNSTWLPTSPLSTDHKWPRDTYHRQVQTTFHLMLHDVCSVSFALFAQEPLFESVYHQENDTPIKCNQYRIVCATNHTLLRNGSFRTRDREHWFKNSAISR